MKSDIAKELPLDVCENAEDAALVAATMDFIVALCKATHGPDFALVPSQVSIIVRCLDRLYEPYFNSRNEQTGEYDQNKVPTMKEFPKMVSRKLTDLGQVDNLNVVMNEDPTKSILMDANNHRNGVVFGVEGHGKPVVEKLRMIALIQAYANSRLQAVQDGLEAPHFAALLVEKYSQGIIDAAELFLDARKLYELVDQETEKIDPDFRNHTAERYRSFADISLNERASGSQE